MATNRLTAADRARAVVERFSFRNLTIAIGVAALVAAVAAALSLRAPERWEASSVLIIDNPLALATAGDDGAVNKLDRLRGKYATLAGTQAIAGPVAESLRIPPGAVIGSTDVVAAPATLSLIVTGRAPSQAGALARTSAMAEGIVDYVEAEHEANDVPPVNRFQFDVAHPARIAVKTSPSSERARESAALAFVVALVAAYVVLQLVRAPLDVPDDDPHRAG